MPWTVADVDKHNHGLSDKQKAQWVAVANRVLAETGDDARAIREANAAVRLREAAVPTYQQRGSMAGDMAAAMSQVRESQDPIREAHVGHFFGAWLGGGSSEGGHPEGNWNDKVSETARSGITDYTDTGYIPINEYLRTGAVPSYAEDAKSRADRLREAMRPMDAEMTLYRGTTPDAFGMRYGGETTDSLMAHFQPLVGSTIADKGFVSTADNTRNLFYGGSAVRLIITAPKGTMAVNVGRLGMFNEGEVILSPNTKLRIDRVEPYTPKDFGTFQQAEGVVVHATVVR